MVTAVNRIPRLTRIAGLALSKTDSGLAAWKNAMARTRTKEFVMKRLIACSIFGLCLALPNISAAQGGHGGGHGGGGGGRGGGHGGGYG